MAEPDRPWRVIGFDTFAHEQYGLGLYQTRAEAMAAARAALANIQRTQPDAGEIQDDVGVVDPDGNSLPLDPA